MFDGEDLKKHVRWLGCIVLGMVGPCCRWGGGVVAKLDSFVVAILPLPLSRVCLEQ